jgi:hypothetical protein
MMVVTASDASPRFGCPGASSAIVNIIELMANSKHESNPVRCNDQQNRKDIHNF